MHPETLYGKLVASHTVSQLDEDNVLLYADLSGGTSDHSGFGVGIASNQSEA